MKLKWSKFLECELWKLVKATHLLHYSRTFSFNKWQLLHSLVYRHASDLKRDKSCMRNSICTAMFQSSSHSLWHCTQCRMKRHCAWPYRFTRNVHTVKWKWLLANIDIYRHILFFMVMCNQHWGQLYYINSNYIYQFHLKNGVNYIIPITHINSISKIPIPIIISISK